jgi:hypothetical protein
MVQDYSDAIEFFCQPVGLKNFQELDRKLYDNFSSQVCFSRFNFEMFIM